MPHKAFLVGIFSQPEETATAEELVNELAELADTLEMEVVGSRVVRIREPNPKLLVGEGKAQEIVQLAENAEADVIVFDDFLTPSQQRNWEQLSSLAVIDRQEVILDIFAAHAKTNEATLQVQLAQANYSLPRLKRRWTHLNRQGGKAGGMGAKGEGEQQLEIDSRVIRNNIAKLKRQLEEVQQHRKIQRAKRLRKPVPVAAIVGYTNAGKSSLLNAMTHAGVLSENKLFATLDPTVRRFRLPGGQDILLADTVGFIRKLPHTLVEAFKSTLEETALADFIIEVCDASAAGLDDRHETTLNVLDEIGAGDKPIVMVLNKMDLVTEPIEINRLKTRYPDAVFASTINGMGLDELAERVEAFVDAESKVFSLVIPHDRYGCITQIRANCSIISEEYDNDGVHLSVKAPKSQWSFLQTL
ncbi:MAG: GTPase HflX [Victivallales bacterium]|nr:GTPase HflX [Victivallales bacterium]